MGYELGAIIFAAAQGDDHGALVAELNGEAVTPQDEITLAQASRREFQDAAVAEYRGRTLVVDHLLPYDCKYVADLHSALDRTLMAYSRLGDVLCFYLDDASGSSGFAVYRNGARIRCRAVDPERVAVDEGVPLAAESDLAGQSHDDERRIFALTRHLLGVGLDDLVSEGSLVMQTYALAE